MKMIDVERGLWGKHTEGSRDEVDLNKSSLELDQTTTGSFYTETLSPRLSIVSVSNQSSGIGTSRSVIESVIRIGHQDVW